MVGPSGFSGSTPTPSPRRAISCHTHILLGSCIFSHLLLSAWSAFCPSSPVEHLLILQNSLSCHLLYLPASVTCSLLCTPAAHTAVVALHCDSRESAASSCGINIQHASFHLECSPFSAVPTTHVTEERGLPWALATPPLWSQLGHSWDFPMSTMAPYLFGSSSLVLGQPPYSIQAAQSHSLICF